MKKNRTEVAKKNAEKTEALRELCEEIFHSFECPGEASGPEPTTLVDRLAPWINIVKDQDFDKIYAAVNVTFAFGYAVGQMLDIPDVDCTPIQNFLRDEKSMLYFPHKKKAA